MARPTLYNSKFCEQLIKHMSRGLSFESFGGAIGVSRRVLYDWEKQHPEFLHAKEVGHAKSLLKWELAGIRGCFVNKVKDQDARSGYRVEKTPIIPAIWKINMKNRFAWAEKVETEVTLNPLEELSEVDLDRRIAILTGKLGNGPGK